MTIERDEKFSDSDLMYGGVNFYGDRKKVEQLYKDLSTNMKKNKDYNPHKSKEKIDPTIKLTCDNNNIEISNVLEEILYIEFIEDIEFVDDKAYFYIALWGGGFLPYVIFDKIVKKYEVDYINLSIAKGTVYFYSKNKEELKIVLNKVLKDLEIEVKEEENMVEISIEKKDIIKDNINAVFGIYKKEDYYYFYIKKQEEYYMTFSYMKELLDIDKSISIAMIFYNMNSGFTCYDQSNIFCKGKYIIDGPQEYYFDIGENSKEWFESKDIQGPKYDKTLNSKKELIDEVSFLTDKKIENDTNVEEMEKYLLELNDFLYDDIVAFVIHNINRVKEVPYYL